jgi:hypothetical protein
MDQHNKKIIDILHRITGILLHHDLKQTQSIYFIYF